MTNDNARTFIKQKNINPYSEVLNQKTPGASQVISHLALQIGLKINVIVFAAISVISFMLFVWFNYTKVNSSIKSIEKSLSLSISLGDSFQIAKQFESFVESGIVTGVWLYDIESGTIIGKHSKFQKFEPGSDSELKILSLIESKLTVASRLLIYSPVGKPSAVILAFLDLPIYQYFRMVFLFFLIFTASTFYLTRRFTKIGEHIAQPIQGFAAALSVQGSLVDDMPRPSKFPYKEVQDVYDGYFNLMGKLRGLEVIEKQAAIGRVTSQLSHDMRAPLGTFERLLLCKDENMPAMRSQIRESLRMQYSMVESLRRGEIEDLIIRTESDLDFSAGLESLAVKAESRAINFQVPKMKLSSVSIDRIKIERSWLNLASNAIDFARSCVKIDSEVKEGDLYIRVIDDGPGVPDVFLSKLFERGATFGKLDGTGLGLAYVRQIMRGHGGDVTYRREEGLTIFECRIPNAVEREEDQVVENTLTLGFQLELNQVRKVAICLEPKSLTKSVLAKLSSHESGEFSFSEERSGAHIVVSNIDEIMFEVLEADEQEFIQVSSVWGDETGIVNRLRLKFNLS